ncbi:hypothetical protein NPIL_238711 [Nephila pilipes]|uniref:Uncharacterized protein n=1 Tax=Nephila pilipes TaxID=299642 RepID=A0A8X6NWH1_NEPPI|nr:hypothetical protein NPIL_238711 [Nephila pilipes]
MSYKEELSTLLQPYRGPYEVLAFNPTFYTMSIRGGKTTVSIGRLKSAFILPEETRRIEKDPVLMSEDEGPETTTRSDHRLKLVVRF